MGSKKINAVGLCYSELVTFQKLLKKANFEQVRFLWNTLGVFVHNRAKISSGNEIPEGTFPVPKRKEINGGNHIINE